MTSLIQNDRGDIYEIDDRGYLTEGVKVTLDLSDIINTALEGFLDLLCEESGFVLLCDQEYEIIGFTADTITFMVKGDVSMGIESSED